MDVWPHESPRLVWNDFIREGSEDHKPNNGQDES